MSETALAHKHVPGVKCPKCGLTPQIPETLPTEKDPIIDEERGIKPLPITEVRFGENGEKIEIRLQKGSSDCGQTCLEMLGYEDHGVRNRELTNQDIYEKLSFTPAQILESLRRPESYTSPHMVLVPTGAETMLASEHNHWVVRVGDFVLDPAKGILNAKEFDNVHKDKEIMAIKIPPLARK